MTAKILFICRRNDENTMDYHNEPITRNIIKKVRPYVPSIFIGGRLTAHEVESYSKETSTAKEREEYFGLAGTIFSLSGTLIAFVCTALLVLHLIIFRSVDFIGIYFFLFLLPLIVGNSFTFKTRASELGKIKSFTTKSLLVSVLLSLVISLTIQWAFLIVAS